MPYGSFKLFAEIDFNQYFHDLQNVVESEINSERETYILNVNETEYIAHVHQKLSIETAIIQKDKAFAEDYESIVSGSEMPMNYFVRPEKGYPVTFISYRIPFVGNSDFFKMMPSSQRILWTEDVYIKDSCLCYDFAWFEKNNPDFVKRQIDEFSRRFEQQYSFIFNDIIRYNSQLEASTKATFAKRKSAFLQKNDALASIGIPLRRRTDTPNTFSVPSPMPRKITINKPIVTEKSFKPEPTMSDADYKEILQIINDTGKQFERLPSTYSDMQEEHLRDHFLLVLQPRFKGTVTGETFNKSGKTDILLRYESSNLFVAECKFWTGPKGYHATIDQLLGYLTWRDSKVAVIIFVDNKAFTPVIDTVKAETPRHQNYLGHVKDHTQSWFEYRLHINGDRNREVKVSILLFHLPKM